jgi:hypothetical protein
MVARRYNAVKRTPEGQTRENPAPNTKGDDTVIVFDFKDAGAAREFLERMEEPMKIDPPLLESDETTPSRLRRVQSDPLAPGTPRTRIPW